MTKIVQYHSGSGDNVNEKVVIQSISPKAVKNQIDGILSSIRHRCYSDAKKQINYLRGNNNLDNDTNTIITVLQLQYELALGHTPKDANQFNTYRRTLIDPYCTDIITSTQIRLDSLNARSEDARSRYEASDAAGPYTCEAFYEFIANESELAKIFSDKYIDLTEIELCGLVRGAIRVKAFELGLSIAQYLQSICDEVNSQILVTFTELHLFDKEINGLKYWSTSRAMQKKILELCDRTVTLLNKTDGNDNRVVNIAASLLQYIYGDHKRLADTCWKYITKFDHTLPEDSRIIRSMYEVNPSNEEEILVQIRKAKEDEIYRKKTLEKIINLKDVTLKDVSLLRCIGDKQHIQHWLKSGGNISNDNQFENDFLMLELEMIACSGDVRGETAVKEKLKKISADEKNKPDLLNQPRLLDFSEKLLQQRFSVEVVELLKPHIVTKDVWFSPLVKCYLQALLLSEQYCTLREILNESNRSDWTPDVWKIQSELYGEEGKLQEAIETLEIALTQDPLSAYYWVLLIHYHRKNVSSNWI